MVRRVPGPTTAAFNFMDELEKALVNFFTNEDCIGIAPDAVVGKIYWQKSDDWLCPWRITRIDSSDGMVYGYPCGEPKKALLKIVK